MQKPAGESKEKAVIPKISKQRAGEKGATAAEDCICHTVAALRLRGAVDVERLATSEGSAML